MSHTHTNPTRTTHGKRDTDSPPRKHSLHASQSWGNDLLPNRAAPNPTIKPSTLQAIQSTACSTSIQPVRFKQPQVSNCDSANPTTQPTSDTPFITASDCSSLALSSCSSQSLSKLRHVLRPQRAIGAAAILAASAQDAPALPTHTPERPCSAGGLAPDEERSQVMVEGFQEPEEPRDSRYTLATSACQPPILPLPTLRIVIARASSPKWYRGFPCGAL